MLMRGIEKDDFLQQEKEYTNQILERIRNVMRSKGISQKILAERCQFSTAATSKILNAETNLSMNHIFRIASALELQIESLVSQEQNELDQVATVAKVTGKMGADADDYGKGSLIQRYISGLEDDRFADSILFDPSRPAFKGIINDPDDEDDLYYFYTKPTISEEKNAFLKGKLKITAVASEAPYCKSVLELKTGQIDLNGKAVEKTYTGEMLISLPMRTCYLLMFSPVYAEVNMISFQHMFLNHEKLQCRIGACLTTSAGSNRRPTLEKCIISRVELNDQQLSELEGQLYINSSKIRIRTELLEEEENKHLKEQVLGVLGYKPNNSNSITPEAIEKHYTSNYYEFEEMAIIAAPYMSSMQKIEMINRLRKLSDNPRYCKVSSDADEYLFAYLCDQVKKQAEGKM